MPFIGNYIFMYYFEVFFFLNFNDWNFNMSTAIRLYLNCKANYNLPHSKKSYICR